MLNVVLIRTSFTKLQTHNNTMQCNNHTAVSRTPGDQSLNDLLWREVYYGCQVCHFLACPITNSGAWLDVKKGGSRLMIGAIAGCRLKVPSRNCFTLFLVHP